MGKLKLGLLVLALILSVAACSSKRTSEKVTDTSNSIPETTTETTNLPVETSSNEPNENKDGDIIEEPTEENTVSTQNPIATQAVSSEVDWRQFLEDYEEWVDQYIEFMKKYNANPSDITLISDYYDMIEELATWSTKIDDMEKELEEASPGDLIEFSGEISRILLKLSQVTY